MYSGKGTPRRKVKKVHKSSGTDDKKLQTSLKKLNVQPIQAIEEVNMFKEDGNVIHFAAPKGRIPSSFASFPSHALPFEVLPQLLTLANNFSISPRIRPFEHFCNLRRRRGQRTHGTCPRYPEPAWPRQPCVFTQVSRELPEPTKEGWRGGGKGGG